MNAQPPVCEPEPMDSEDELFILYTSGTGKGSPTAVMHTQAGFLLYTTAVHKVRWIMWFKYIHSTV